jgi:hypothetical protein
MRGGIPQLPNTSSWRGAHLKSTGTTLRLTFTLTSYRMSGIWDKQKTFAI